MYTKIKKVIVNKIIFFVVNIRKFHFIIFYTKKKVINRCSLSPQMSKLIKKILTCLLLIAKLRKYISICYLIVSKVNHKT